MKAYERLLKYVTYPTGSNPNCLETPSSEAQWDLAKDLKSEMEDLGLEDVILDEHCYLMGTIPSNIPDYTGPVLGLIAHLDVSSEAPFENIKPKIIHYEGGDIIQDKEQNNIIEVKDYPFIEKYRGCDIITSDGSTLLGADNKAGIAEILTLAEILKDNEEIKHGPIRIAFTPDEEIGRSSDFFDLEKFGADFAYTVDGGAFGECQSETFNAFSATVNITGHSIHPGCAKNKMINAAKIATEFVSMLPKEESPELTEGYEGFYHLCEMEGNVEKAKLQFILRDHDYNKVIRRCEFLKNLEDKLNKKYGKDVVLVDIEESYRNMKEVIDRHPKVIEIPLCILEEMGVNPDTSPIRGGTDGAFLSFKGLPCPNLGTGGHNFHSRGEFAVIQSMDKVAELLTRLAEKVSIKD